MNSAMDPVGLYSWRWSQASVSLSKVRSTCGHLKKSTSYPPETPTGPWRPSPWLTFSWGEGIQ